MKPEYPKIWERVSHMEILADGNGKAVTQLVATGNRFVPRMILAHDCVTANVVKTRRRSRIGEY
jgi:hypothetical protein